MTETIRVGGVPEHFNYPWHIAIERGIFEKHNVKVEWVEQKCGTGAMITALKDSQIDIIIALTEGLVSDICQGSELRIISSYVNTPLCWAISTGKNSKFNAVEDLKGQKFGISRLTSGSHLMLYALALERSWDPQKDIFFEIKGDFKSLRDGVNDNSTAAFLWETFTTKPFHDSGEIRRIGDITTPWPCFLIASSLPVLETKLDAIRRVLLAVQESCKIFATEENMSLQVSERYNLQPEDAKQWYQGVKIMADNVSEAGLQRAVDVLFQAQVLKSNSYDLNKLIDPRVASLLKDIKYIKLYNQPELVKYLHNSLHSAGLATGSVTYDQLLPFDQHHYHGTEALDQCAKEVNITKDTKVVNIGSGLGGPARYFAGKYGAQVLALELQDDLHRTALELTSRCNLKPLVTHMCGDVLDIGDHIRSSGYDVVVSWLTFLHIPERARLVKIIFKLLKPGGFLFCEDFFELKSLSQREKEILSQEVFCNYLPSLETYKSQLTEGGFKIVKVDDLTSDWTDYCKDRVEKMVSKKDELVQIHGQETFDRLRHFYSIVSDLFKGGNLGGGRFIAQKVSDE
eukprot:TRINITY_DN5475_c0_g1_i1.p1 TRINITY_DN5475_c0_g1~~TRINITY_DN5475_c0_g1_i1.p1  ORF type:complete len:571 (+),score=91.23 TRINITY_DN5475_c0_g1_i1:42-1754(+)